MFGRSTRLLAASVTLAIGRPRRGAGAQSASAQDTTNEFGTLSVSKVTGEAKNGATFAGKYNVKRFVTGDNGRTKAVGTLTGKVTKKNGDTERVTKKGVRMTVRPAQSTVGSLPVTSGQVAPQVVGCEVLDLVLGPLDLEPARAERPPRPVHLNITAVPGAGKLLGNLLCAVAGLLDSPSSAASAPC